MVDVTTSGAAAAAPPIAAGSPDPGKVNRKRLAPFPPPGSDIMSRPAQETDAQQMLQSNLKKVHSHQTVPSFI